MTPPKNFDPQNKNGIPREKNRLTPQTFPEKVESYSLLARSGDGKNPSLSRLCGEDVSNGRMFMQFSPDPNGSREYH
jgi:hypothetical protein